jgi:hypothetical protein
MKNIILYLGILTCLFITPSTSKFLDVSKVGTYSYGISLLLLLSVLLTRPDKLMRISLEKEYLVCSVFFLYFFLQIFGRDYENIKNGFFFMIAPILVSILVSTQNVSVKRYIVYLVLLFFFAECGLALYERYFEVNIFPYEENDSAVIGNVDSWMFRSSAFLGHPLNNALAISIIMGFIFVSNFSDFFKSISISIGFVSLLCFNARGAIIIWCFIILYYYWKKIQYSRVQLYKLFFLFLAPVILFSIYYVMFHTILGGRLVNEEKILDGSALTRLDVFSSFNYISAFDLLLGNSDNYKIIMDKLGAGGIENSYVVIIVNYGIIVGILLIIALFNLVVRYLGDYRETWMRLIIIMSFVLIGSLNNSLAINTPWNIFLICANVFPFLRIYESEKSYKLTEVSTYTTT